MSKSKSPATAVKPLEDLIAETRRFIVAVTQFEQCKLAAQVEAGRRLTELRHLHGNEKGGRPETSEKIGGFVPWPVFVKATFAISDDTARNWMAMAGEADKRLKKMGGSLDHLLDRPLSQLTEKEYETLKAATRKLTEGRTQMEFWNESGLYKTAGKGKGGTKEGAAKRLAAQGGAPIEDTDEQASIDLWKPLLDGLTAEKAAKSWVHLPRKGEVSLEKLHGLLIELNRSVGDAMKGAGK